ncbi:MAG TPA: hypothetical protein PLL45_19630 [Thermoflexales bacterium]|nr:hypothetical protein [Thermoflexales bacterium]
MQVTGCSTISDDRLVGELWARGVAFVGGSVETGAEPLADELLLAGLASSAVARVQLAIIPLLLRYPHLAHALRQAADMLAGPARVRLMCYATAATLLQQEHGQRLVGTGCGEERIDDVFSSDLDLVSTVSVEDRLAALAQRQASLTGRDLNWRATYEHAAERLMTRLEREAAWAA